MPPTKKWQYTKFHIVLIVRLLPVQRTGLKLYLAILATSFLFITFFFISFPHEEMGNGESALFTQHVLAS